MHIERTGDKMRKRFLLIAAFMLSMTGCGRQNLPEYVTEETDLIVMETEQSVTGTEHIAAGTESADSVLEPVRELTEEEMREKFYEQYYAEIFGSENFGEEIEKRLIERSDYYVASGYYDEVVDYWENIRQVRDIANRIEPLYFTEMKYYTREELQQEPLTVIHLAKNEIYAKHGYIFRDADLNNYFMGCAWYQPTVRADEFDDAVFNDYERENLKLLASLDTMRLPLEEASVELTFSSGAGAWESYLVLKQDGTFEGSYHDGEMGEQGENYPGGSIYHCEFSGQFDQLKQIDANTYSLQLKEVTTRQNIGLEWIEDGIRYVAAEPYGLEAGREFYLYLPETSIDGLPEEFLSWWPGYYLRKEESPRILSVYGLYNKEKGYGFFSYDTTE